MKFRCTCCDAEMWQSAIRVVHIDHPKPGRDRVAVNQCPECGECEQFENVCDEPGCGQAATCGWPTTDGDYRRTCGAHMRAAERAK